LAIATGINTNRRKLLKRAWGVEEIKNHYPLPIEDPLLRDIDLER